MDCSSEIKDLPCGNKNDCTGCGACAATCPKGCISMQADEEGFLFPVTNSEKCTHCGGCSAICPINQSHQTPLDTRKAEPIAVYAAWNLDEEIRRNSSSGGVFSALAECVLSKNGAVFGATLDENLSVQHIFVEDKSQLHLLRGAKYAQSKIGIGIYLRVKECLRNDRMALFSGTPCQVAGLKTFLRKPYENLICCDIVCHGVPSQLFLDKYLDFNHRSEIMRVYFRNKNNGWKEYCMCLLKKNGTSTFRTFSRDHFMIGFLRDYGLRESCYSCIFATISRCGDISIGDFWGVGQKYPQYDDDRGTSLLLVNTNKGKYLLDQARGRLFIGEADIGTAVAGNPVLIKPRERPDKRNTFYHDLKILHFSNVINKYKLRQHGILQRITHKTNHIPMRFSTLLTRALNKIKFASCSIGSGRNCNLCGWSGRSFSKMKYPGKTIPSMICPRCFSYERHRLAYYLLKDQLKEGNRTLHVAPESQIEFFLRGISEDYLSIDIGNTAMAKMSLTELKLLNDSRSLIWCSHVLEHIPEDRKAMSEMYRVLAPGGVAIVAVPVYGNKTYEDASIVSPQERLKAFKQEDHVRLYGLDISLRLKEAGFNVSVLEVKLVPNNDVVRYGLDYPSTREVFLCRK